MTLQPRSDNDNMLMFSRYNIMLTIQLRLMLLVYGHKPKCIQPDGGKVIEIHPEGVMNICT